MYCTLVEARYHTVMSDSSWEKRVYDHRLRDYVRETRYVSVAVRLSVPKSTISGWLKALAQDVVTHEIFDLNDLQVRRRILNREWLKKHGGSTH
jgi:hypothetical protein